MYNNEATAHGKLNLKSLLICWLIILGGYLLIRMVFLVFGPCAAAVLLWGTVSVEALQEAKTVVLFTRTPASCRCREADIVFPRRVSVRDQSVPCHSGHGGNWND